MICEASSFQLEDTSAFAPECAVLLNVEADHLDRHGDLDRYREAKLRIFANQRAGDVAVLPEDLDGELPIPSEELRLRGAHNLENARAAAIAAGAMGVPPQAVAEACALSRGFPTAWRRSRRSRVCCT